MIVMDSIAQLTLDIIAKVVESGITIANAAKLLSKSRRTIERYVKRYRKSVFNLLCMVTVVSHRQIKHQRRLKKQLKRIPDISLQPYRDEKEAGFDLLIDGF